jgi:DNA repair protein RadC
MFPNGQADPAIRLFARYYRNSLDLKEVCFYRFVKAEPLMEQVIDELLLPDLGIGRLPLSARSTKECAQAIVDALRAGGIVKADRLEISYSYRDIPLPAFAFVLHSEFPEPGMYDTATLEVNRTIRAMLWNPDRILPSLYELRNQGFISKVSEIDNVRQFTTKWSLEKVVEQLVNG